MHGRMGTVFTRTPAAIGVAAVMAAAWLVACSSDTQDPPERSSTPSQTTASAVTGEPSRIGPRPTTRDTFGVGPTTVAPPSEVPSRQIGPRPTDPGTLGGGPTTTAPPTLVPSTPTDSVTTEPAQTGTASTPEPPSSTVPNG